MVIIYYLDAPIVGDSTFNIAVPGVYELTEIGGKLYAHGILDPIIHNASLVGWFATPEQLLSPEQYEADEDGILDPIPRTVGELNLNYDWPEGFIPLPGTGIPEKLEHIENFLTKMFPTRGI